MNNIWYELASFSNILGNIPYNVLLSSDDIQFEDNKSLISKNHIVNNSAKINKYSYKKDKYSTNNLLATFGYIRNYFKVKSNENENNNNIELNKSSNKISRNDLEVRLANKIQELKNNKLLMRKKGKIKNLSKNNVKDSEIETQANNNQNESSFQFSRIVDNDSNNKNKDYLINKESKIKKINRALRILEKEEKMLEKLPQDEKKEQIKKIALEKAMKKAQGIKVKDNKSKLIKSKKQIQAKKKKSKKRWNEIKNRK